jgi:hypothetical protein
MVGGILEAALRGKSVEEQVKERVDSLLSQYQAWWTQHSAQVSTQLAGLQSALIAVM